MITKEQIDLGLKQIEKKLPSFEFSKRTLKKFTSSKEDIRFLGYLNGTTGYYQKALPLIIETFKCKNIVELGNREGISTIAMWDGLPHDARLTTIDIIRDLRYCPEEMFADPRIKFLFGDVNDLSIFGDNIPMDIDFLFSDTIHYDFQVSDEFEIYQHLLADTALVAIDDININDKREFFDRVPYNKWDLSELYHPSGWGLFLYRRKIPLSKEERILNAYKASARIWKRKSDEACLAIEKRNKHKVTNILRRLIKKTGLLYVLLTYAYNHTYSMLLKKGLIKKDTWRLFNEKSGGS